jgi:hypothetical protein
MRMGNARWTMLAVYVTAVFVSIPYTRSIVTWAGERFGQNTPVIAALAATLAAGALMAARLRNAVPPFPRPHLALLGLGLAAAATWRLLASSPIALVHLPEYSLLALLAGRAFGRGGGAALGGGSAAAAVGLLDEVVQGVTPGRVFDWWDVALNAAASALGALALAWWRWTGRRRT